MLKTQGHIFDPSCVQLSRVRYLLLIALLPFALSESYLIVTDFVLNCEYIVISQVSISYMLSDEDRPILANFMLLLDLKLLSSCVFLTDRLSVSGY